MTSKFLNLFKNFSLTKSFKKEFAKMYKKDAPILNHKTTTNEPTHFPSIKPANNETGEPNPKNGKTHNIVNNKNNRDNIKMLFFLIFEKYSILSFINS